MSSPRASRLDSLLVAAAIAFAFLAASFAAANSDLWLHLAAGRLIATGGYSFGSDPFSFWSGDQYWANHAWLFDLAAYEAFQIGGGAALVGLKAVGVAVLAGVMLRLALRGGGPIWLAAGSTLLALLAMSPRLLVQPQCLSLLLLAICFALLTKGGRSLRWVPPLIVLWVNVDSWFILGPLLVLLFSISRGTRPRWLLPASFFACLVSPHHVHAFALPPELAPAVWTSTLHTDPVFAGFFASPWRLASFGLASWAFPVLLLLSGCSFLVNRRTLLSPRFAVWLPFALLAAWQARLVPFFAVIAGPVLAMNLGEVIGPNALLRGGRLATLGLAAVLLVCAWPGWLQSFHARERSLAWDITPDPSLVRAAQRVHDLHEPRVFTTHPEAAHYIAWFAPGVRAGLDSRLNLFSSAHTEHNMVRASLGMIPNESSVKGGAVLSACGATLILLFDPDRVALGSALRRLSEPDSPFALLEVDGSALLVATDSSRPRFDADRLAFVPDSAFPAPPASGPPFLPDPDEPPFWDLAANRAAPHTWEGEAAPVLVRLFELSRGPERSPALPLLAARAARTGVAQSPRSDEAWNALARAYLHQSRTSWEAGASTEFMLLKYLRHVQLVGALRQAVLANPDAASAHELLAGAFSETRMIDLALHHRREQMRLLKRSSMITGETSESRNERLASLQAAIESLEREVFDAENRFRIHTISLTGSPLERARVARNLGLGVTALDTLVKSHPDLYGVEGLRLLVDLLLQSGRLSEARVLLDREELQRRSGSLDVFVLPGGTKNGRAWRYSLPAYDWFDFCQHAAAGNFENAEAALERLRGRLVQVEQVAMPQVRGAYLRAAVTELGSGFPLDRVAVRIERDRWGENVGQTQFLTSVRGDLHALSGLLCLERGAVRDADRHFRQALERYAESAGPDAVQPGRPLAVRYRETLRIHAK